MTNRIKLRILMGSCVLAFLALATSRGKADICETYPPKEMEPVYTYQGRYENGAWGYAVSIPKGYKGGLYQDPGAPQHGIMVILSWEPRATIRFEGEANSLEEESTGRPLDPFGHCIFSLNTIRQYAKDIKSYEMHKAKLGSLDGYKYIVRYSCPDRSDIRVKETIVAVSGKSPVYRLTLETSEQRYKKDHIIFKQMLSTWRLIQRK